MSAVPVRELFLDERGSALRVTWHRDRGLVAVSLWHGDVCVGTVRLDPVDAARLAGFLVDHLGALASEATGVSSASA